MMLPLYRAGGGDSAVDDISMSAFQKPRVLTVAWLSTVSADHIDIIGGKAASLGEVTTQGLPIPPGFVVTADSYHTFIERGGIDIELFDAVDVDTGDARTLATAEQQARSLITESDWPEGM